MYIEYCFKCRNPVYFSINLSIARFPYLCNRPSRASRFRWIQSTCGADAREKRRVLGRLDLVAVGGKGKVGGGVKGQRPGRRGEVGERARRERRRARGGRAEERARRSGGLGAPRGHDVGKAEDVERFEDEVPGVDL